MSQGPSRVPWWPLPRLMFQGAAYVVFGLIQLALDTAIFIGLSALGVPLMPSNIAGRIAGACLGFMLNGRVTFATGGGNGISQPAFARFVLLWLGLTVIGTGMLSVVEHQFGLVGSWYAKPLVEAMLAVLGFVGLKFFVFRAHR